MCKVMNARQVGKRPTPDRVYAAAGVDDGAARVARQEPRVLVRTRALSRGGAD